MVRICEAVCPRRVSTANISARFTEHRNASWMDSSADCAPASPLKNAISAEESNTALATTLLGRLREILRVAAALLKNFIDQAGFAPIRLANQLLRSPQRRGARKQPDVTLACNVRDKGIAWPKPRFGQHKGGDQCRSIRGDPNGRKEFDRRHIAPPSLPGFREAGLDWPALLFMLEQDIADERVPNPKKFADVLDGISSIGQAPHFLGFAGRPADDRLHF